MVGHTPGVVLGVGSGLDVPRPWQAKMRTEKEKNQQTDRPIHHTYGTYKVVSGRSGVGSQNYRWPFWLKRLHSVVAASRVGPLVYLPFWIKAG